MSDRGDLGEVIYYAADAKRHVYVSTATGRPRFTDLMPGDLADEILASDWLAERDRRMKAEGWSEGHQDGWSDRSHITEDNTRNPYQEEPG